MTLSILEAALKCVNRGWYIFPLEFRKKTPDLALCPHWSQDSTNDPTKVREWFEKSPNANFAIDLGRSNFTVLDFDAGDPPANLNLPKTFTVRTGKGQHLYFQGSNPQCDMHFGGKHVGEVKSAGGYVVGPRSLHPTGAVYEPIDNSPIAPLPLEILEKLTTKPNEIREPVDATTTGAMIPHGQHDNTLLRISRKLRGLGLEREGLEAVLMEIAEKRLENPGSDWQDMVKKHAETASKFPVNADETPLINGVPAGTPAPQKATADPKDWKDYFCSVGQLEEGDVRMVLDGFLPEGINMIGGQAGEGKTLFVLSLVKSLTTGEPFLGLYQPDEIIPIIYMIPESSSRAFKMRCKAFRIPDDPSVFICRTVTEGRTLMLSDPMLLEAVKYLKPVIVLDTLPRFNESGDENDAAANKKLVDDITALRALGAIAIIGLHHSTKASAETEMTLQNVLRGTGDLGAMCDSVYALRRDRIMYNNGAGPNEIEVQCVKARDMKNPPIPFKIAATYQNEEGKIASYIDETGDFHVIQTADVIAAQDQQFAKTVTENPQISRVDLAKILGTTQHYVQARAKRLGFIRTLGRFGRWQHVSTVEADSIH